MCQRPVIIDKQRPHVAHFSTLVLILLSNISLISDWSKKRATCVSICFSCGLLRYENSRIQTRNIARRDARRDTPYDQQTHRWASAFFSSSLVASFATLSLSSRHIFIDQQLGHFFGYCQPSKGISPIKAASSKHCHTAQQQLLATQQKGPNKTKNAGSWWFLNASNWVITDRLVRPCRTFSAVKRQRYGTHFFSSLLFRVENWLERTAWRPVVTLYVHWILEK